MLDRPASAAQLFDADLSAIRALAGVVPGPLPVALNAVKFAASIRLHRRRNLNWAIAVLSPMCL